MAGAEPKEKALNIAADEVSVYEGGNLFTVRIEELLDNEVAVRQVVNERNRTKRQNRELEDRVATPGDPNEADAGSAETRPASVAAIPLLISAETSDL